VRRQILDLLVLLVQNRERVLTKAELSKRLWQDTTVGEGSLATAIYSARSAVGDDGTKQRVIATVYGRGYRFVAEVQESDMLVSVSHDLYMPAGCLSESVPAVICGCPLRKHLQHGLSRFNGSSSPMTLDRGSATTGRQRVLSKGEA
jgi:hypothetical protein